MLKELDNDDWRFAFVLVAEPEPVFNGWVSTRVFGLEDVQASIALHCSLEEVRLSTCDAAIVSLAGVFYLRDGRFAFVALEYTDSEKGSKPIKAQKLVSTSLKELIDSGLTSTQRDLLDLTNYPGD